MLQQTPTVVYLILVLVSAAYTQTNSSSAIVTANAAQPLNTDLPDSAIGRIMRTWFEVVNGGKEDEIRSFVEGNFSTNAFKYQQSAEQYTALFVKLYQQSGGLEIVRVTPNNGVQPMTILTRSRIGDRYARITAGMDSEENKLAGMGVDKAESPNAVKLDSIAEPLSQKKMLAAIEQYLDQRSAAGDLSGVVLIAKDDQILFQKAYGFADREAAKRNTIETKFHIASVGKMFTAVAIGQLVKAGKLSFDDTVAKVLPEYPNQEIARKVTIRQLLTHSAGLGTFFESPGFVKGKTYRSSTEEIEVYKDEKLFFEPSTRWRYSNAGYSLLGAIIEHVSGKTYLEYIRENILNPVGMKDTYTNSPGKPAPGSSVFYTQSPTDPLGLEPFTPNKALAGSVGNSFGGGLSTAPDMFKFLRAYRTGKLVGDQMTQAMVSDKVNVNPSGSQRDGYGIFETESNGEFVRGHSGGSRTDVQILWNSGYTVVIMTNAIPPAATSISGEAVNFITKQNAMHRALRSTRPDSDDLSARKTRKVLKK
jgi:CubicO group peptidase (beta-lactamase class C family)